MGYGLGTIVYGKKLADWIKDGKMEGMEFRGKDGKEIRASL